MLEKVFQKDEKFFYTIYELLKFLIIFISFIAAFKIRFENDDNFQIYFNLTAIFYIICFLTSTYRLKESFYNLDIFSSFIKDLKNIIISSVFLILILYLSKTSSSYSRIWFFIFIFFNLALIFPYKILMNIFYLRLIKSNLFRKNVLLIGDYKDCLKVLSDFSNRANYHFRGMALLNKSTNYNHLPIQEIKLDDKLQSNLNFMRISQIWLIYNFNYKRESVLNYLYSIPIDVRTVIPKDINSDVYIDTLGSYSFYNTSFSPFFGINYFIKIILDFVLSIIFLILVSPIILICSLLIFIEDGRPIFFKQKRYGWDGSHIIVYKLRSLIKESDTNNQVIENDRRLLKIGKIIRRLSIDELPQFLNIIKGEMSLVGPRPHPINLDDKFSKKIRGFMQRLRCKPGLTGLAQVSGFRGPTVDEKLMVKRYECDLEYIKNWSLYLDIKIILKTIIVFLFQKVD